MGRLLGMRLVYFRPNMTRRVSFELMNRQLVWHGFAVRLSSSLLLHHYCFYCEVINCVQEFLLFLMPLINWDRIKTFLIRRFNKPRNYPRGLNPSLLTHTMACGVCNIEPAYNPYPQ